MMRHPYKPVNKRGLVLRVHTTSDSVRLEHRDAGPCVYVEHGTICGKAERVSLHREPFYMVAHGEDQETSPREQANHKTRDVPVL